MTPSGRVAFVAFAVVVWPSVTAAQVCRGTADINANSPGIVGGTLSFPQVAFGVGTTAKQYALTVGGGNEHAFGLGEVGGLTVDGPVETRTLLGTEVAAGGQIRSGAHGVVCPTATFSDLFLHDADRQGHTLNAFGFGGGVSAGERFAVGAGTFLIPSGGVFFVHTRATIESAVLGADAWTAVLGVGVVNGRFAVTPQIVVPIAFGSDATGLVPSSAYFQVSVSMTFGQK